MSFISDLDKKRFQTGTRYKNGLVKVINRLSSVDAYVGTIGSTSVIFNISESPISAVFNNNSYFTFDADLRISSSIFNSDIFSPGFLSCGTSLEEVKSFPVELKRLVKLYEERRDTSILIAIKELINKHKQLLIEALLKVKKSIRSLKIKIASNARLLWHFLHEKCIRVQQKVISNGSIDEDDSLIVLSVMRNNYLNCYPFNPFVNESINTTTFNRKTR